MAYTMLKNNLSERNYTKDSLEMEVLMFIRNRCENLGFDNSKDGGKEPYAGRSIKANQIPYNMEKDIDRLCMENAIVRFLKSGKKEDAFDVYFCYLEMFVGDYEKTRRMIELLSEFEANGSGILMKHRDHYSHSVYVFCLGLAIYESNSIYRDIYKKYYEIDDVRDAACHYLNYWGLASLFHDIGYPFELPFEQACSYFEVDGDKRERRPFLAYQALDDFVHIGDKEKAQLKIIFSDKNFETTDELFAYLLTEKFKNTYGVDEEQMLGYLKNKPAHPDIFGHFMDHAYFSATILFKKLFGEMECNLTKEYLDSLTAILMHNSLYKFCIANPNMNPEKENVHLAYKQEGNIPFKAEGHPLAYMLMLCDELQCWDRTAYGRNSKKELHPMGCTFDFSDNKIKANYLYDEMEMEKVDSFKDEYIAWLQLSEEKKKEKNAKGKLVHPCPQLKAYSGMFIRENGISDFQRDIERIVDLTEIKLVVETGLATNIHAGNRSYISNSNFINLYNFAVVLNGRWNNSEWKKAKEAGQEEKYISDESVIKSFGDQFKELSLEYKLSNINQAKAFAKYMNAIGCFYTDKPVDFEMVKSFTAEDLIKIGPMEHQRWLQERYDMGWTYGNPDRKERELLRQHRDMIPDSDGLSEVSDEAAIINYERLDKVEQDKDTEPMECMLSMLKMYDGLRIYRFN